jgi:hypothetical protein
MFLFFQQLHFKNFRGASKLFEVLLMISVGLGMITGIAYIGFYAWNASFFSAIIIFVIGLVSAFLYKVFESIVGSFGLSMLGFIGWPIAAFYMFKTMP